MASRLYLTIAGVAAVVYGLGFVLIPAPLVALFGAPPQPYVLLNARLFGAVLLAVGVIEWFARDFREGDAVRGVLIGALIGDGLVGLINVWGTLDGLLNALAWTSTIVLALLLIGAGSCLARIVASPEGTSRRP
jgi:hypothetical protein